ncbi:MULTISPECIES: FecR family protein [Pseudomonas]|jgi:transmembrane sensor|uniref:Peptide ABC transporter substrate-binding protein n=2 Tax=Pseudomonas TaxID=286 RepID=A0A099N8G3_PSEDL|nr:MULTISPECIES: FecR family protein [Pseudomonas]AHZ74667.1 anti-FecI sigma factor FecR [Pseudomonas putida]AJG16761.1 peptide ABC transporter substrate-binding protein [Pseudomonas plecoglossicida]ESW38656.1 peptide ABC transporter substrate-binding protein [Pseudomonas taiwanensis SJ9]KAF4557263.1 FecR family protein [Pseudomonas sp. CES]KGK28449.1 peptide ABC transporter substrate-binding protein [Pseudomonas plecoglossicida]
MTASQPGATAVKQAIQLMLRLRESGHAPALQQECRQWRTAHHEHEQAWQRVIHLHQDLDLRAIPGAGLALQTLETSQRRLHRRQALKLLGGVAMVGTAAWLGKDLDAVNDWTSDYTTGTGERRSFALPDGSQMQLNTRSTVDLAFNDQQRLVRLKQGEVMIACNTQRSLLVETRDALLEGFEGRFVARQDSDCTQVSVSHGRVAIHRPDNGQLQWIESGQNWRLDALGTHRLEQVDMDAMAWTEGLIVTRNMRLFDFLAQVSRYRHGYLGCSDGIADLRLSGVFRLEDPEQLLQLLPRTLPVRLRQRTRWWVRVEGLA